MEAPRHLQGIIAWWGQEPLPATLSDVRGQAALPDMGCTCLQALLLSQVMPLEKVPLGEGAGIVQFLSILHVQEGGGGEAHRQLHCPLLQGALGGIPSLGTRMTTWMH